MILFIMSKKVKQRITKSAQPKVKKVVPNEANKKLVAILKKLGYPNLAELLTPRNAEIKVK